MEFDIIPLNETVEFLLFPDHCVKKLFKEFLWSNLYFILTEEPHLATFMLQPHLLKLLIKLFSKEFEDIHSLDRTRKLKACSQILMLLADGELDS